MTRRESEHDFLKQVRGVLDGDVENLDGATRSRLTRMRQAALDAGKAAPRHRMGRGFRWLAGAAAAAAVVIAVVLSGGRTPVELADSAAPEDFEVMALEENLDFYEELDFYAWLAETEDNV